MFCQAVFHDINFHFLFQLIGWVFDEGNQVLNELVSEKIPAVSQDTCKTSHNNFFTRFTSEYTYCAGKRSGKMELVMALKLIQ